MADVALDPAAERLARVYADAEAALSGALADEVRRALQRGDDPATPREQLEALRRVRRQAQRVVRALDDQTPGLIRQVLETAARLGAQAVLGPLAGLLGVRAGGNAESFNRTALDRLVASVTDLVTEAHRAILRTTVDAFREVMLRATPGVLIGAHTRRQASQRAMWAWSDRGVTGFTDQAGRRWELSSYAEMATRTAAQRATVAAQLDRLEAAGHDLVIVSDNVQECALCRPFEGKVLAIRGAAGRVRVEHAIRDGEMVEVDVVATVADAMLRGLFHPNCRHSLSVYLPGVTKRPTGAGRGPDPEGDRARDRQRAIEREIRRWKRRRDAAVTTDGARHADRHVRAWQQRLRDHLDEHPDLKRLRYREAPGAGNLPTRSLVERNPDGPFPDLPDDEGQGDDTDPEDLGALSDEQLDDALADALEAEDMDRFDWLTAEADRRDQARQAEQAAEAKRAARRERDELRRAAEQEAKAQQLDELLEQGVDEEQAVLDVYGISVEQQRRDRAIAQLRGQGYRGSGFDDLARQAYRDEVYRLYLEAEGATNGHMLTRQAEARNVDPLSLFSGPEAVARANASDELLEWWDQNGRLTYAEWTSRLLGERGTGPTEDFLR